MGNQFQIDEFKHSLRMAEYLLRYLQQQIDDHFGLIPCQIDQDAISKAQLLKRMLRQALKAIQ